MNKNDISRMARQAGFTEPVPADGYMGLAYDHREGSETGGSLECFAALVAAAERERIKAANAPEIEKVNAHIKALEDAVAAEREACAEICDRFQARDVGMQPAECAGAIRARGQE